LAYTHFRFIAYEVPTACLNVKKRGPDASSFDAGAACDPVDRIPINDPQGGLHQDAKTRLLRLARVVERASRRVKLFRKAGKDDDATLKVFVTPEFYFRPPATFGAGFEHDTYPESQIVPIFEQFKSMFRDPAWKHWLIVGGTVMWNLNPGMSNIITGGYKSKVKSYFNTAVAILGGQDNGLHYFEKRLASDLDGVPVRSAPGMDLAVFRLLLEQWTELKKHVVEINGTRVGVEVCLDHSDEEIPENYDIDKFMDYTRTLRKVRNKWYLYETPGRNYKSVAYDPAAYAPLRLGLHLLTACGMTINRGSVAADVGGYILRNDGLALSGPRSDNSRPDLLKFQSELRRVRNYKTAAAPIYEYSAIAQAAELGERRVPERIGDVLTGAHAVPMKGPTYKQFPQRLVYYRRLPLPAP
jgi:hypothetical protein